MLFILLRYWHYFDWSGHLTIEQCENSRNINNEKPVMRTKNPTSQDESGVLFQTNHVDPPLRVKGAGTELIDFNIQRKFGDVNEKKVRG